MAMPPEGLAQGGDSSAVHVKVTNVKVFDGTTVIPPTTGVTVVVGANNSGKSTFLREISQTLSMVDPHHIPRPRVIKELSIEQAGTSTDLLSWLIEHRTYTEQGNHRGFIGTSVSVLPTDQATSYWNRTQQPKFCASLGPVADFFVHYVTATNRANGITPKDRRPDIGQSPQNPMHRLEDDSDLLERVQELSRRIFRQTLTLDPLSGNVQLRVGKPTIPAPPVNAITREYRDALVGLDPLHEQGDGMTAVLGLLVPILCGTFHVVIVDEPEAFLHPPQARLVGQVLGELSKERNIQMFLATHDRNMLIGLLSADVPVTVIRLDRGKNTTRMHKLDHKKIQELWDNPVLRYSNILDGLFHRAVILCEAERDCTFYAASLDAADASNTLPFPPGDALFVPAGGKDGIPGMVKALHAISVPAVAVPDLDLLNDPGKTRTLIEAVGGNWAELQADYGLATQSFHQPKPQVTNKTVLDLVSGILNVNPSAVYDNQTAELVKAAIRTGPNPWDALKAYGTRAFKGQAAEAAQRLLQALEDLGIALVRDGVLERLAPTVYSSKGASWLREALEKQAYRDQPAQDHIHHVIKAIESRRRAV